MTDLIGFVRLKSCAQPKNSQGYGAHVYSWVLFYYHQSL